MCAAMSKKMKVEAYRMEMGLTPAWSQETEEYLESFTERETLMLLFYLEAAAGREVSLPGARKGVQATAYKARGRVMEEVRVGLLPPKELINALMTVAPKVTPDGLIFAEKAYHGTGWEKRMVLNAVVRHAQGQTPQIPQVNTEQTPIPAPSIPPLKLEGKAVRHLGTQEEVVEDYDAMLARLEGKLTTPAATTGTPLDWYSAKKARVDMAPDPSTLSSPRPSAMEALKPAEDGQGWGLEGTEFEEVGEMK